MIYQNCHSHQSTFIYLRQAYIGQYRPAGQRDVVLRENGAIFINIKIDLDEDTVQNLIIIMVDLEDEELVKSLLELFDRKCKLCHQNYDLRLHIPMMLCLGQHICCQICINNRIEKQKDNLKCPFCPDLKIKKNQIFKVRRFDSIIELHEKYEIYNKKKAAKYYENVKADLKKNIQYQRNLKWLTELQQKQSQIKAMYSLLIDQAKDFFRQKKVAHAIQILEQIIMQYPESSNNIKFIGFGSKEQAQGYYCDIQKWFDRQFGKSNISPYDLLNLCYLNHGNFSQKKEFYLSLSKISPDDYRVWFGLALAEHNNYNYDAAGELYLKVINMKEQFDKPYEMLAFIELQQNSNNQKAINMAQKALSYSPKNIFAKYVIAIAMPQKQTSQKLVLLEEIIQEDSFFLRARKQLGVLHLTSLKQLQIAEQYFRQCIALRPSYDSPKLHLAECLISSNRAKEAIQLLNDSKESSDFNKSFSSLKGRAFMKIGDNKNAIFYFEKSNEECNQLLADLYLQEGMYEKALNAFKSVVTIIKDHEISILMKMAQCYTKMSKFKDALTLYQNVLLISPDHQKALEKIVFLNDKIALKKSNTIEKKRSQSTSRKIERPKDKTKPTVTNFKYK